VTRAAYLWRGGERYQVDATITNAPLWWVNGVAGGTLHAVSMTGQRDAHFRAERAMPAAYVPGEPVAITITTSPGNGVRAYAVEEAVPATWAVSGISHDGVLDPIQHKVKWGPFLDAQPLMLTYALTPPVQAGEVVTLNSVASFDGVALPISGQQQIRPSSRLALNADMPRNCVVLRLSSQAGAEFVIETSANLLDWTSLDTVHCATGQAQVVLPVSTAEAQRFYRVRFTGARWSEPPCLPSSSGAEVR